MVLGLVKRIILIVLAGILAALAILYLCVAIHTYYDDLTDSYGKFSLEGWYVTEGYTAVFALTHVVGMLFCAICALAVVDLLICIGQKKYSMSMFGIGVALFVLILCRIPLSLGVAQVAGSMLEPRYAETWLQYNVITQVLFFAVFLGLAVAYVCLKYKYLKRLSME